MNILIVKLSALGDVLRTTSLLRPLHWKYRGCSIAWLTSAQARPLLEGNRDLREVLAMDDSSPALTRGRFDLVLSMEEDLRAAAIAERACSPDGKLVGVYPVGGRLRYTRDSAPYYRMSLLNRDPGGGLKTANAFKAANQSTYADLWLDILQLELPLRGFKKPRIPLQDPEILAARRWAHAHGLRLDRMAIGLNPGAGARWPAKQLSVAKAAEIAGALHAAFKRPVLLFGGPDEAARNRRILKLAKSPLIDAGTDYGVREFAAFVGLCDAIVTTDSLAFHVATAVNAPVIGLVGPTSAAELDCFGAGELVKAEPCECFYKPRCLRQRSCLDDLPVQRVVEAVGRWLDWSGA